MRTPFLVSALAITLAGCSSLTPAGLIAASRLDPLDTAPGDLAVAVSVPSQVRLRDGDAMLSLTFAPDDASKTPVAASVPLSVAENADSPTPPSDGTTVYTFAFAPDAAAQLTSAQTRIKAMRASGIEGKGSLSIGVDGGCLTGELNGSFSVATWLKTSPQASFVSLSRETDLFVALPPEDGAELEAALMPC